MARPRPRKPTQGRAPDDDGYWVHGHHAVQAALANPARRALALHATREAIGRLGDGAAAGIPVREVRREDLDRLLPDSVHQGIALRVRPLDPPDLEGVVAALGPRGCLVLLDQVTDPQNTGAILRAAAAFGAAAVLAPRRHAAPETGALAKAASGALERVPYLRIGNLARTLALLRDAGIAVVGFAEDGAETLGRVPLPDRIALVVGAEGPGLRRLTRDHCDRLIRLPTEAGFATLNVATATAVGLYEWARGLAPRDPLADSAPAAGQPAATPDARPATAPWPG